MHFAVLMHENCFYAGLKKTSDKQRLISFNSQALAFNLLYYCFLNAQQNSPMLSK